MLDRSLKGRAQTPEHDASPIGSMYGIFTYIYYKNQQHVGEYAIHGSESYGLQLWICFFL